MKTFEYRLYPTQDQQHRLQQCLIDTWQAYNTTLEHAKQQYEYHQAFSTTYDRDRAFAGTASPHTPATTLQTVSDRLAKALTFLLNHRHESRPMALRILAFHASISELMALCCNHVAVSYSTFTGC